MKPIAIISERLDERCADWLAEHAEVRRVGFEQPEFPDALAEAHALIVRTYTRVDAALIEQAANLKVVARAGVGLDNIDLEACRARGVAVVHTPEANTQAVVEYVFALLFDHFRPRPSLPPCASAETFHEMRRREVGRQLDELSLGVLGFGRIGRRVGQVAHALGMNLLACDLLPEAECRKAVDYPFEFVDAWDLVAGADVVSVHVDGRSSNRRMINRALLSGARDEMVLLNAARGMLVDHDALADWLSRHPQAAAILDVHDPEPPPENHPLWDRPNARLMPHLASRTDRAMENMSWVVRDVVRVLKGQPPRFPA